MTVALALVPTEKETVAAFDGLNADQAARFEHFCAQIEEGDTVREALKAAGIAWGQVCRWVDRSQAAEARYGRARSFSADLWACKATEAAEDVQDKDDVPAARLKFEAR